MRVVRLHRQRGYALLLMVVVFMGIGGVVASHFTQGVKLRAEHERYLHNERVLREAKQALLQFAYNYPQFNDEGPGRLPCPDSDNDGLPNLTAPTCQSVGRFPWAEPELNFYDVRDASNERLWYAVSSAFYNLGGGPIVNSASTGTITVQDRSGAVLYNGAANGVAAVIIAPGPPIDRNGVLQNRPGDVNNPVNYLDLFGAVDNADFVNGTPNGFVTGPIVDLNTGTLLVNDQMILVTTEEIREMAEKATLQAYRNALREYLADTGGQYPWLYNYDVATLADINGSYPADSIFNDERDNFLDNHGRVPSMFDPYFGEANSESIESKISVDILNADLMGNIGYTRTFPSAGTGVYTFVNTIWNGDTTEDGPANIDASFETSEPVTGLRFEDDGTPGNGVVQLIGSIAADETYTISNDIWFWSRQPPFATEWAKCKSVHIEDCHVDGSYIPDPHGTGQQAIQILHVTVQFTFDSSLADLVEFTFDTAGLPGPPANPSIAPADNNGHAQITATFAAADISTDMLQINYEWDDNYTDGNWDVDESGRLDFSSLVGPSMRIGLRFYPELPDWVFDNGWQNSVMMAYADDYRPDSGGGPCTAGNDCLAIDNWNGIDDDKISLFVIAGEHDWVDSDVDGSMDDELAGVFDPENDDRDNQFDAAANGGNDRILMLEEL